MNVDVHDLSARRQTRHKNRPQGQYFHAHHVAEVAKHNARTVRSPVEVIELGEDVEQRPAIHASSIRTIGVGYREVDVRAIELQEGDVLAVRAVLRPKSPYPLGRDAEIVVAIYALIASVDHRRAVFIERKRQGVIRRHLGGKKPHLAVQRIAVVGVGSHLPGVAFAKTEVLHPIHGVLNGAGDATNVALGAEKDIETQFVGVGSGCIPR